VAEPVIQQQGLDRIVVQLPGVQDTAKAKDILGRTATLEMRLVDESAEAREAEGGRGPVPFGAERYMQRDGRAVIVKKQVIITGDSLTDAQPGFDSQNQQPKVDLTVDAKGGRIMRDTSRENLKKRMAILLFEKGKGEVLTAPVIQGELGNRFQISGSMTVVEANDLALLLRAGSLAAPMEIIEERTIGPSLGAENIAKGFNSVTWGFPGDRGLHGRLLHAVRALLRHRAGGEPAAAGGHPVHAAGHVDLARHGGHGAGARHGHRFQRADQRAGARRASQRGFAASGHPRRV
jgi:preprotein translocase subunit SecD